MSDVNSTRSSWLASAVSNMSGLAKKGVSALQFKQQLFKFILVGAAGVTGTCFCFYIFEGEKEAKPDRQYKTSLTSGSDRFSPQKAWFEQVSSKLDEVTKRLSSLEATSLHDAVSSSPEPAPYIEAPFSRNDLLEQAKPIVESNPSIDPILASAVNIEPVPEPKRPHTSGIHHVSLSTPAHKALKTGDNTIPAGAFAEGVLLGGVDASTSIQASSDPRPVLLRLTNPGTLPRRFKSDLCGCHVLAACYGDISSERVFMRLEKVTCTERKTGEIVEMNIKGYVAGEDGRAGLRRTVVDRAGESVRNAAIGGFIGGMAGFISQTNQNPITYSLASGLSQTPGMTGGDLLKHGAAKGAGNALEKYADFYIKRAEQMQPVIQVQAGRVVDIVTTESTPFEDSAERRSLVHINDRKRYEQVKLPSLGEIKKNQGDEE